MMVVETTATPATTAALTPALYPIRVTHLQRFPVSHYAEHRTYNWYVDIDDLPRLPRWLRPFAAFEAVDHLDGAPGDTLRQRVDSFLYRNGVLLPGGRITALLMPRVFGRAFNPLTLFWCHDAEGVLRYVVAELQTTRGERHAYLMRPGQDGRATVTDVVANAPFTGPGGYYLVRAPRPEEALDLTVSLHRDNHVALVATWRGRRRRATLRQIVFLQLTTPFAPHLAELSMRFQAAMLRLRGARGTSAPEPTAEAASAPPPRSRWTTNNRSWAPL